MSKPIHGRRAHRRVLALIAAGALVAGALGSVPTATAAGEGDELNRVPARATGLQSGRYIVLMLSLIHI